MFLYVSVILLRQGPLGILLARESRAVILELDCNFETTEGFHSWIFRLELVLLDCFPKLDHIYLVVLFCRIIDLVVVI